MSWNELVLDLEAYMERYRKALEHILTITNRIDNEEDIVEMKVMRIGIQNVIRANLDGEPTTADRHNEDWLSQLLACPTCKVDLASIIEKYPNDMKLGNKIRTFANGVNNATPK